MKTVCKALIQCNSTQKYLSRDGGFVSEADMSLSGCLVRLITIDEVLYIRNNYHGLYLNAAGSWESMELDGACMFSPFSMEKDLTRVRLAPLAENGSFTFAGEAPSIGAEDFTILVNTQDEHDVVLSSPFREMSHEEINQMLEVYTKGGRQLDKLIDSEKAFNRCQGELLESLGKNWTESANDKDDKNQRLWTKGTFTENGEKLHKWYIRIDPGQESEATLSITQRRKLSHADNVYIKENFDELQEKFGKEFNKQAFIIKYTARKQTMQQSVLTVGGPITSLVIIETIISQFIGWVVNKLISTLLKRALNGETATALERYMARAAGSIVNLRSWSTGAGLAQKVVRNSFRFIRFLAVNLVAAIAVYYIFKLVFKQQSLTANFYNITEEDLTVITPCFDNVANQSSELGNKLEEGLELPGMVTEEYVDDERVTLDKPQVHYLNLLLETNFNLKGLGYLLEIQYGQNQVAYTTTSVPYSGDNRINIEFGSMGNKNGQEIYDELKKEHATVAYQACTASHGLVMRIDKLQGGVNHSYTTETYFVTKAKYDELQKGLVK